VETLECFLMTEEAKKPNEFGTALEQWWDSEARKQLQEASEAYELLGLLNGNGKGHLTCDKDDTSPECKKSWNDFWEDDDTQLMLNLKYTDEELDAMCGAAEAKDKVKKWILPIEEIDCDECIINFPDDLLEAANLKEGDEVEWHDQGDGSFKMIKVTKSLGINEC